MPEPAPALALDPTLTTRTPRGAALVLALVKPPVLVAVATALTVPALPIVAPPSPLPGRPPFAVALAVTDAAAVLLAVAVAVEFPAAPPCLLAPCPLPPLP